MDCLPQIHVAAIHAEAGYNTATPGIGVLCSDGVYLLGAGVYRNSVSKHSNYAIGGKYMGHINGVSYGLVGGMVDGYAARDGHFIPLAGVVLTYKQLHLMLVPAVPSQSPALVEISFTFN
jgi:hypothetical protein